MKSLKNLTRGIHIIHSCTAKTNSIGRYGRIRFQMKIQGQIDRQSVTRLRSMRCLDLEREKRYVEEEESGYRVYGTGML